MSIHLPESLAWAIAFVALWGSVWLVGAWEERKFGGGFMPAPLIATLFAVAAATTATLMATAFILWRWLA